jgi:hypothetical protein
LIIENAMNTSNGLTDFIEKLKAERWFATSRDEAATKQGVLLPVLSKLGWDTFNVDEVFPEFGVESRKVDYALRLHGKEKVFVEVKKAGEDLEKHQEQLLDYAFKSGVKLAALTNGQSWWLYLPLQEGSWEQRKFYTLDIVERGSGDVAAKLHEFLSRDAVDSGLAVECAETTYLSRQRTKEIKDALPRAWGQILSDPDGILVDLLADTTERLCGYKPDANLVEEFLSGNQAGLSPAVALVAIANRSPRPSPKRAGDGVSKGFIGRGISGFTFRGESFTVNSWIDMLLALCGSLLRANNHDFERVLELEGRKRPYFSKNPNVLRAPRKIDGTDLFVESNLSANSIVRLSQDLVALFGSPESSLVIQAK